MKYIKHFGYVNGNDIHQHDINKNIVYLLIIDRDKYKKIQLPMSMSMKDIDIIYMSIIDIDKIWSPNLLTMSLSTRDRY